VEEKMKTQVFASDPSEISSKKTARFAMFSGHPVRTAVLIYFIDLIVATLLGLAAKALFPQYQPEFIALIALSILVAVTLSVLGWWGKAGFNAPARWREIGLVVVPFAIVLGLPFLKGIKTSDWSTFGYLVVAYALTGFMEEGMFRGIVLRVLKPTGVVHSILISSLLFGLLHIGNLLYRSPAIVFAQMLGAFVHGIGLGAIRLRTNTIWFPVILHGLHDLALKYTNFPAIPLDVVQVTLLMLYGIYLLRTWKPIEQTAD
jgi:uncharacterized protein